MQHVSGQMVLSQVLAACAFPILVIEGEIMIFQDRSKTNRNTYTLESDHGLSSSGQAKLHKWTNNATIILCSGKVSEVYRLC